MESADVAWSSLCGSIAVSVYEFVGLHYKEVLVAAACVLVWTVTEPVRSVATRLLATAGYFVYKWADLTQECLRRYRRYVWSAAVQEQPLLKKWWKIFEAVPATPMVVLEAHEEHLDGLGRLLYKWIDAFHAYWCVFLPETMRNGCHGIAKYWNGLCVEWKRTMSRSCVVMRAIWSIFSLVVYSIFYSVLFVYEGVEGVCQGWIGVGVVLVAANYYYLCEDGVVIGEGLNLDRQVASLSFGTVMTGVLSKIWRVFEKDGRSPRKMVSDGYAEWCAQMEELEQVERLSQEFWRLDGGLPTEKKKPVRTRSAALAEKRALQARMREGRAAEARRGRRVSVGEDVTSGYGENRSPRSTDIAQLQGDELWEETATGATARAGFYASLY